MISAPRSGHVRARLGRARSARGTVAALTALAALSVGLLTPSAAHTGPDTATDGSGDAHSTLLATEALDTAVAVLDGSSDPGASDQSPDLSMMLLEVQQSFDDLSAADRGRARALLRRPSDAGPSDGYEVSYGSRPQSASCTTHFCIHWVTAGDHAPDLADSDSNGTPDYVDEVARVMAHVWQREVGSLRYRRPVSDGTVDNPAGETRSGLLDVYLANTGRNGVYGYASTDRSAPFNAGFLVLDNDFTDFRGDPGQVLRATAAHEFFHTVQYAYSVTTDAWFMENTATWMEEQVFDEVNDNRQYLRDSSLRRPARSLDLNAAWYGNWIFFEHLSQRHGRRIVRAAWNRAARPSRTALVAVDGALRAHHSSLATAFSLFAADGNVPGRAWHEGSAYPRATVAKTWSLNRSRRTASRTVRLAHLASHNVRFVPGPGMSRAWRVRVTVTATSRDARAYLLLHLGDGRVLRRPMAINSKGRAVRRLRFARKDVVRVTLNLANASTRFRCYQDTPFTCQGTPLDDGRAFRYTATVARS